MEIKFDGAFVLSPRGVHPTHWLISTQPATADPGAEASRSGRSASPGSPRRRVQVAEPRPVAGGRSGSRSARSWPRRWYAAMRCIARAVSAPVRPCSVDSASPAGTCAAAAAPAAGAPPSCGGSANAPDAK